MHRQTRKQRAGAPGGIRTPNPQIRSLMLCPVELRARAVYGITVGELCLLKIDDLQSLIKEKSVQRLRDFPVGNEK